MMVIEFDLPRKPDLAAADGYELCGPVPGDTPVDRRGGRLKRRFKWRGKAESRPS
jgi:hypothetical protein